MTLGMIIIAAAIVIAAVIWFAIQLRIRWRMYDEIVEQLDKSTKQHEAETRQQGERQWTSRN